MTDAPNNHPMSCLCYVCAQCRRRLEQLRANPTSPGDLFMGIPITTDPTMPRDVVELRQGDKTVGEIDLRQHWRVRWRRAITANDRRWARRLGISLE